MVRYKKIPFFDYLYQKKDYNCFFKIDFIYFSTVLRHSTDTVSTWLDHWFLRSHFLYDRGSLHGYYPQTANLVCRLFAISIALYLYVFR